MDSRTTCLEEDMVERVAMAMMKADWDDVRPLPPDVSTKNYYTMARAAIEAMREPTEAMVIAAERADWNADYSDDESTKYRSTAIYHAMIDAALTSRPKAGTP